MIASWKSLYEIHFRQRFCKSAGEKWMILLRIQGSHHIYGKPGIPDRISVPIHGNKSLKTGLLRHFLKVAELTDDFQPVTEADENEGS